MADLSPDNVHQRALTLLEPRWKWIFSVYFFLALVNVRTKAFITDFYYDGQLLLNHDLLLQGKFTAPQQFRLLQYYIPELLHRVLSLPLHHAYLLQRLGWTALTFIAFHLFLKKWFDTKTAMIGTVFLAAVMQMTYFNHLQESDPLNLLIFLLGLWAIRENAFWPLVGLLAVGSLNKLTIIYLPVVYFLYWYRRTDSGKLFWRTIVLFAPLVLIAGAIRWYYSDIPYMTSFFQLQHNLEGIYQLHKYHLGIIVLYGVFWIMAFKAYREKPLFFRRAVWIIPPFLLGHFLIARMEETRLFLPLAPLLIPMGLFYLFREHDSP